LENVDLSGNPKEDCAQHPVPLKHTISTNVSRVMQAVLGGHYIGLGHCLHTRTQVLMVAIWFGLDVGNLSQKVSKA